MSAAKLIAALVAVILTATACGSRLPDDVLEALDARATSGVASGAQTATEAIGADTASPIDGAAPGAGTAGAGTGAARDTGESGNDAAASGPAAVQQDSRCAEARSAAPGVSDTEIRVASIVTDSGPLPGATEGSYRGAAAYFALVNALGGVCGRKVTIVKGDDGLDPAKARGEFLRLEPRVFAFVGSFSVADSGYIDLIASTGVPYVSLVVDPAGRDPRNVMPRTPTGVVSTGPFVWWKQQHPNVSRAAVLYAAVGGVSANVPGFEKAIERAGFDRRYTSSAEVASPDYTPQVRQAQDEGIEFLYLFAFEVNMHIRLIRNMRQQNYDPPIKGSNIAFNTRFSELLGQEGDGWENHNTHLLFLDPQERTRSEALAAFIDWNERVFPGAQLDLFPVSGWGRAALFTEALQKIEGAITREALIEALYEVPRFDGGGIEETVDPRTGLGSACWNMAVHRGGRWVRGYPSDKLFECDIGELFRFE